VKISWLDMGGVFVGAACAVHCVAFSLVPALLVGFGAALGERLELGLVLSAVLLGSLAVAIGLRRHRRWGVALLFGLATVLLGSGLVGDSLNQGLGTLLTVGGGAMMITAHLLNARYCVSHCSG